MLKIVFLPVLACQLWGVSTKCAAYVIQLSIFPEHSTHEIGERLQTGPQNTPMSHIQHGAGCTFINARAILEHPRRAQQNTLGEQHILIFDAIITGAELVKESDEYCCSLAFVFNPNRPNVLAGVYDIYAKVRSPSYFLFHSNLSTGRHIPSRCTHF